jgi:Xaa-Pro aminopeptidase
MSKSITPSVDIQKPTIPKIAETRFEQLHYAMDEQKVDAIVVTFLPHIRYLTNYSGSAATLFITKDELHFFTDDRYEEQIKTELYPFPNLHTYITRDVWGYIAEKKVLKGVNSLAFEADRISYSDAVSIRNQIKPIKFKPATAIVERYTVPKDPMELEFIQKACDLAVQTYEQIKEIIKAGVTEREVALEIAYQSRKLGSEKDAFDIIVTSGPRGAIVHGQPTDRKMKYGDVVILDFGCTVNGFVSDITRTVAIGKSSKEQKAIYQLLYNAKEAAIAGVRPGMNGKVLDKIARSMIEKEGYGQYFQHSLGHGVGLQEHETPIITFRQDDQIVHDSCVLAIEPGIYIPDQFGMRIEDECLVTRTGGKHLTKAPDKLVIV